MFFFLSTIYLFFYFSKNLFYKLIFFFIFYITSILFFLIIKKNIFGFFLMLLNASALIIFFTFLILIINFKNRKRKNIYLFFQCPILLQKVYEYLYGFFFPVKTAVKTYEPGLTYKKNVEPDFSFLHPETDPGMATTQGIINYGRRLISQLYDSDFEETGYEESLGIVEDIANTHLETQTV